MGLNLISVENASNPQDEFVILQATAEINLKGYAMVDRTFQEDDLSNEFRHVFFFPDRKVQKDDYVLLTTGKGENQGRTKDDDGDYLHVFFWQSDECIWNDNGKDRASLIKYTPIKTVTVPAVKK